MDQKAVNRFASTLAGTFRSFYIYNQDNKAFDDILQNLVKRFQDTQDPPTPIEFTITNRSLLFKGEPTGFAEVTVTLASLLKNLGYKSLCFQAPLQSRHFFQFLHIITGKDSTESKNEKLQSFISDTEIKPIRLVPMAANAQLLKLTDEALMKRLAPLRIPSSQGGPGFVENAAKLKFSNSSDFLLWARSQTPLFKSTILESISIGLIDATREGYFPWERFSKIFPGTDSLLPEWEKDPIAKWSVFSVADTQSFFELNMMAGNKSPQQNLDFSSDLMNLQDPSAFSLGLSILLRVLSEKPSLEIQQKGLKLANEIWKSSNKKVEGGPLSPKMEQLRKNLCSYENIANSLTQVRTVPPDNPLFIESTAYFQSLGMGCLPALIKALEEEQERGMRRKLLIIIPQISHEEGVDILLNAFEGATPFLIRNIIAILGDIKSAKSVLKIIPYLNHDVPIVKKEAQRSLLKIGTDEAKKAVEKVSL